MCGIFALLHVLDATPGIANAQVYQQLLQDVQKRGPDKLHELTVDGVGRFAGAVLHIRCALASHIPQHTIVIAITCMFVCVCFGRGAQVCPQPVATPAGNVLLWNGEVFGGEHEVGDLKSDTLLVAALLDECHASEDVVRTLASVHGPYSFVWYHAASRSVFYGRDPFGRRSLVVGVPDPSEAADHVVIASVASRSTHPDMTWTEVPVGGVFVHVPGQAFAPQLVPWPSDRCALERPAIGLEAAELPHVSQADLEQAVDEFERLLLDAVGRRVKCLHRDNCTQPSPAEDGTISPANIAVLFSGGLDSTVIAAMAHLCAPAGEAIDLLNVSFDAAERAPDRLAAICSLVDLKRLYPEREWRLVHIDVPPAELKTHTSRITNLVYPCDTHMDFNIGSAFWFASRGVGYVMDYDCDSVLQCFSVNREGQALLRQASAGGQSESKSPEPGRTASGAASSAGGEPCRSCRRVAKAGCAFDLCKKCCVQRMQQEEGAERCYVHKPRSKQEQMNSSDEQLTLASTMVHPHYESRAKVLLIGIGADEQMAGYGRHRSVFLKAGWRGLQRELQLDTGRLWQRYVNRDRCLLSLMLTYSVAGRNLGRDDRCTSDHGREARFPFLDEEVVQSLHRTPLNMVRLATCLCGASRT